MSTGAGCPCVSTTTGRASASASPRRGAPPRADRSNVEKSEAEFRDEITAEEQKRAKARAEARKRSAEEAAARGGTARGSVAASGSAARLGGAARRRQRHRAQVAARGRGGGRARARPREVRDDGDFEDLEEEEVREGMAAFAARGGVEARAPRARSDVRAAARGRAGAKTQRKRAPSIARSRSGAACRRTTSRPSLTARHGRRRRGGLGGARGQTRWMRLERGSSADGATLPPLPRHQPRRLLCVRASARGDVCLRRRRGNPRT